MVTLLVTLTVREYQNQSLYVAHNFVFVIGLACTGVLYNCTVESLDVLLDRNFGDGRSSTERIIDRHTNTTRWFGLRAIAVNRPEGYEDLEISSGRPAGSCRKRER